MIARDDIYCFLFQCHLPNLVSSVRPAALWPAQLIKSPAQQTTARMDALLHKLALSRWSSAHPGQGLATTISFYYVCFPSKRSLICSGVNQQERGCYLIPILSLRPLKGPCVLLVLTQRSQNAVKCTELGMEGPGHCCKHNRHTRLDCLFVKQGKKVCKTTGFRS